jgi:hypothetical protein
VGIDADVAEEAVHLFDGVFRREAASGSQTKADGVNAGGGSVEDAQDTVGEREHSLGMEVVEEAVLEELMDPVRGKESGWDFSDFLRR